MRRSSLPTLPDAVAWLRREWGDRETPTRLHLREHDGWGLMYTPAFARRLGATPHDQDCDHPPRKGSCQCAWRYPMWRAMVLLAKRRRSAHDVVLTLVINAWDTSGVASIGFGEGLQLASIRSLFEVYERAPVRVGWVDKSAAQQAAEGVVA